MFFIPSFLISLVWNAINLKKISCISISFGNIMKEELQKQEDIEMVSLSVVNNLNKNNAFIYRDNFVQFLRGATLYYIEVIKGDYCLGVFCLSLRDESAAYTVTKLICACNLASQSINMFSK